MLTVSTYFSKILPWGNDHPTTTLPCARRCSPRRRSSCAISGLPGFSLRRVAERAGVSRAAPYRHFRDREEILSALIHDTQRAFTAALRAARERERGSSLARLARISEAYLDFARSNPERLSLMFSEPGMAAVASIRLLRSRAPPLTSIHSAFSRKL